VYFDYSVPDTLVDIIAVGQLVQIPFRSSTMYGIVFAITDSKPSAKTKPIDSIVHVYPLCSKKYLDYMRKTSEIYGIALGTLLKMGMLPLQKRKLKTLDIAMPLTKPSAAAHQPNVSLYSTREEHAHILQETITGTTLILVPEIHLVNEIIQLLSDAQKEDVIMWHSELSTKEKFSNWVSIVQKEKNIIIATRNGLLLPFAELDTIICDYEHDENHKQWDGIPRIHTRHHVSQLAALHNAQAHFMSYSLSVESYYNVQKQKATWHAKKLNSMKILFGNTITAPTIVHTKREIGSKHYQALIEPMQKQVQHAINAQQHVFLFVNRRPIDKESYTITTQVIEHEIAQLFPNVNVIRIEKETTIDNVDPQATIYIGTTAAFPHLPWDNIGFIGYLDIDRQIAIPEFDSLQSAWHIIQKSMYYKHADASFYIQTRNPDHMLFRSLHEPDRFYRTELSERKSLLYPPYSTMFRYMYGHESKSEALNVSHTMYATFKYILTNTSVSGRISHPIEMNEQILRGKYWYGFIIRFENIHHDILQKLHEQLDDSWRVDPHPISLIST